jgi:hypothetical protein
MTPSACIPDKVCRANENKKQKFAMKNHVYTWADIDALLLNLECGEESYTALFPDGATLPEILRSEEIPDQDGIWLFCYSQYIPDRLKRLFAVRCARRVQHLMQDPRSFEAAADAVAAAGPGAMSMSVNWAAARAAGAARAAAGASLGAVRRAAIKAVREAKHAQERAAQVQIALELMEEKQ